MSMERQFRDVWERLRGKKPSIRDYLEGVHVEQLRGITDLTLQFPYPVMVIGGTQGTGKSTIIAALACAYKVPKAKIRDFVPSTFFPQLKLSPSGGLPSDAKQKVKITYSYISEGKRLEMTWARNESWSRSFAGRQNAKQPERHTYVRTLASLTNPSEVRGVLQLDRRKPTSDDIDPAQIAMAARILPFRYKRLSRISAGARDILFAWRESAQEGKELSYSEFHMSGGERSCLRLSRDVSHLDNAIVLIDEVEAALHPYTQHVLMLELQRMALRQNIQFVVSTHSPAIFDTVPPEARVFLERGDDGVVVQTPYRDLLQKAFYGRSFDKLSILCEDEAAEAILRGVMDHLIPKIRIRQEDVEIGRDTGKNEFPSHVRAVAKFNELEDFIFVMDGDAAKEKLEAESAAAPKRINALLLPGSSGPEAWCLEMLAEHEADYKKVWGLSP